MATGIIKMITDFHLYRLLLLGLLVVSSPAISTEVDTPNPRELIRAYFRSGTLA